jgi:hypothetical protein
VSSPPPKQLLQAKQKRILRGLGMALSALMVCTVLVILLLIVRTERAHDEARCVFAKRSERSLGDLSVVEETRSCLPELEERRYLVTRPAQASFELARKRMPRANFAPDRYRFSLREDPAHLLVLRIDLDGQLLSEFHEVDARPSARDPTNGARQEQPR